MDVKKEARRGGFVQAGVTLFTDKGHHCLAFHAPVRLWHRCPASLDIDPYPPEEDLAASARPAFAAFIGAYT